MFEDDSDGSLSNATVPVALGGVAGGCWVVGLAAANALIWWAMEAAGGSTARATLLRFGAVTSELLRAGEWWRAVSAVFLHIGARHLVGNSLILLVLGLITQRAWGAGRMMFVYVLSGMLGNWASFVFGSGEALKAGASGAILGLLGGLAGARIRQLRRTPRGSSRFKIWHVFAMLVAFYGFVVGVRPSSDHAAHLGGIASGMIVALLWADPGALAERRERWLQLLLGGAALSLGVCAGLLTLRGGG